MTNAWGCANRRRDELSRDPNRDFPYEQAPAILYLLYHTIPYYTILYHTIPYYTILYHTIPYYTYYGRARLPLAIATWYYTVSSGCIIQLALAILYSELAWS